MKFGLGVVPGSPVEVAELAVLAEERGFDQFWVADSPLLFAEPYTTLAYCATRTSRIHLGPGVTNPYSRHPVAAAGAIATVDVVSVGRAVFGIGRGDSAVRMLGQEPSTLRALEEYIQLVKGLTAGETVTHRGRSLSMRWATRRVPVYISASGPSMLRLAGRLGDGVQMCVGVSPDVIRWARGKVSEGAREVGRDPADVDLGAWVVCIPTDDISSAREKASGILEAVGNFISVDRKLNTTELPSEFAASVEALRRRRASAAESHVYEKHLDSRDAGLATLPSSFIEKFAILEPVDSCVERLKALQNAGVNRIDFMSYPFTTRQEIKTFIETIGREVIPRLT